MQLKTACPNCDKTFRVAEALISKSVRCPACQKPFVVSAVGFVGSTSISPEGSFVETRAGSASLGTDDAEKQTPPLTRAPTSIQQLGRFAVSQILGSGAFGIVYRAFDPVLDRQIALKVPRYSNLSDRKIQRFLTEAKSAGRLRHPNIVPVYETGLESGKYFIAYEYVQGQVMSARIHDGIPDLRQAVTWIRDLALALAYAHEHGVIHRDVKPDNIMIDARQSAQLLDFGLARQLSEDSHMTIDGSVIGTPAYMPPEQARGNIDQVGPHCDQYSLGVVLYEVLTGRRPFEGTSHLVLQQVIGSEPPAPRSLRADVPQDLEAICLKAMEKEPTHRYANCQAFADDLDHWLRNEAIQARPLTTWQRLDRFLRRNPTLAILLTCVSLLLVVSAGGGVAAAILVSRSKSELTIALNNAQQQTRRVTEQTARVQKATAAAQEKTHIASTAAQHADTQRLAAEAALHDLEDAIAQRKAAEEELKSTITAKSDAEQSAEKTVEMTTAATTAAKTIQKLANDHRFPNYVELLAEANACLNQDDRPGAASILEKCEEPLRGWEWRFLNTYATAKVPAQHLWFLDSSHIPCLGNSRPVAISPNGKLLAIVPTPPKELENSKEAYVPEIWNIEKPGQPVKVFTNLPPDLRQGARSPYVTISTMYLFGLDETSLVHMTGSRQSFYDLFRIAYANQSTSSRSWQGWTNWHPPKGSQNAVRAYNQTHTAGERLLTPEELGINPDGMLSVKFRRGKPTEIMHVVTKQTLFSLKFKNADIPEISENEIDEDKWDRKFQLTAAWSRDGQRVIVIRGLQTGFGIQILSTK